MVNSSSVEWLFSRNPLPLCARGTAATAPSRRVIGNKHSVDVVFIIIVIRASCVGMSIRP
jgi:hypothetical protein